MTEDIAYPTVDKVIEINLLVLTLIKVKQTDKPDTPSRHRIQDALDNCRECDGDVYDKAVVLLVDLAGGASFGSGNKRTAFLTVKHFLRINGRRVMVNQDSPASIMLGIREGYYHYSHDEIKEWIKNGRIKQIHG